jgi:5-methylcytosine-specific restriction endonuclease McrA
MFAEIFVSGKGCMNSNFYSSKSWRKLSKAFLNSKNYVCERCGNAADLAHHKVYLNSSNVWNSAISMNVELLEALCINCHNTEHFGSGGAVLKGLKFDERGDLIESHS